MAELPKISIITPSFNQGQYIEQTIVSVINQNYPNLEYIIIDGGSTDNTVDIIKKYEKHITYWVSEPDKGQSDAINKGIKKATGDVINWLNSDDYYQPGTLNEIGNAFINNNTNVVCGRCKLFYDENDFKYSEGSKVYFDNLPKTIGWLQIDQPATFFRKSIIDNIGPVNEQLHYLMDAEWWLKHLLYNGLDGIIKTNTVFVNFRLHPTSKSISQISKFNIEREAIFLELCKIFSLNKEYELIKSTCEYNPNYELKIKDTLYKNIDIKSALHYFLFLKGIEHYNLWEKSKAKIFFNHVDPKYLLNTDRFFFKRVKFFNSYVPQSIIKFLRKIK